MPFKNQSPKFGHLYTESNSLHITNSIAVESLVHNYFHLFRGIVIQLLNCICLFVTPWTAAHRLPCPSLSPWVCSNSCPLSQSCHLTISCSVAPVLFALNLYQHSGSFPLSQLFASGGRVLELQHQSSQWVFRIFFNLSFFLSLSLFIIIIIIFFYFTILYWLCHTSTCILHGCTCWFFFRIDWFDLLAVRGMLKGLLQNYGSKA